VLFGARGGDPAKQTWFKLKPPDVVARNREEGRFEIRGKAPLQGELRLSVQHDESVALEPIAFARGQDDLRVVLARGGRLSARVLCDPDAEPPRVRLALRAAGAPDAPDILPNDALRNASGLEHRWRGLAPGAYVLAAFVRPDPEPALVIRDLIVPPRGPCRDPRLDAIDLRGKLRRIEVAVVGPEGEPVAEGNVRIVSAGGSLPGSGVPLANGKATLPVHRPEVDILVRATGYKPKSLTGVGADAKVTLERGQNVRVALTGLPDPAGKGVDCWLTYDGQPDHDPRADYDFRIPDLVGNVSVSAGTGKRDPATGEYVFSLGETGSYLVRVRAAAEPGHKAGQEFALGKITVASLDGPQKFPLAVPTVLVPKLSGSR
jgi:hypothetical protein